MGSVLSKCLCPLSCEVHRALATLRGCATWEAEIWRIPMGGQPEQSAHETTPLPHLENNQSKMDWRCGCAASVKHWVQIPEPPKKIFLRWGMCRGLISSNEYGFADVMGKGQRPAGKAGKTQGGSKFPQLGLRDLVPAQTFLLKLRPSGPRWPWRWEKRSRTGQPRPGVARDVGGARTCGRPTGKWRRRKTGGAGQGAARAQSPAARGQPRVCVPQPAGTGLAGSWGVAFASAASEPRGPPAS
jgi:hypothetical protein